MHKNKGRNNNNKLKVKIKLKDLKAGPVNSKSKLGFKTLPVDLVNKLLFPIAWPAKYAAIAFFDSGSLAAFNKPWPADSIFPPAS